MKIENKNEKPSFGQSVDGQEQLEEVLLHGRIERADAADEDAVYALYHALIHEPYGTWSEEYPDRELVHEDLLTQQVFVLRDGQGGILSAIVLEDTDEFNDMAAWYADVTCWAQLGRLGVAQCAQGRGVARRMLAYAMAQAKAQGCEAVRFLVGVNNMPAQHAYAKFGFEICGETHAWDNRWLCYEKRL